MSGSLLAAALLAGSPITAEPGSQLTATLITFETGGAVWERFGHNAIWIHDAASGADDVYDYGRFSFTQAHFFYRFVQGKMWYSMGYESDPRALIARYASQGRKIWSQELDLTPAQRVTLRDFLAWNIRPENAEYFYNYYRDNCSTRIRDAIDLALGGAIRRYGQRPSGMTWRDETRRLDEHSGALYTGLLVVLGQPVDQEMSRSEQMFLPMRLREHLDSVMVTGPDGKSHPAVKSEQVLAQGGRWPVPVLPTNWIWRYVVAGLLLGGLMALVGRTRAFPAVATLWTLPCGLLGTFMTWVWAFSNHVTSYRNENLFLFNSVALALAVVLPSALRGRPWATKVARPLALIVVALGALALVVKVFPWFPQHNLEVIALILPVHAGVWLGLSSRPRA